MSTALHQGLVQHVYVPERMIKSMSEIADDVAWRDCVNTEVQSGGVLFARKGNAEDKQLARERVVKSLGPIFWPGNLRLLTLPGLKWEFEYQLLQMRQKGQTRTTVYALERDPAIYFGSLKWMPRRFQCKRPNHTGNGEIKQVSPHCLRTRSIHSYYFTSAEAFLKDPNCPEVDAAWLDFTGTINADTMAALRRFWRTRCTWQMTVTALNGRYKSETAKAVARHGGFVEWIINSLPGFVSDVYRYRDGHSAMVQITLQKDLRIPAEQWCLV
jgi:hypothetical protein